MKNTSPKQTLNEPRTPHTLAPWVVYLLIGLLIITGLALYMSHTRTDQSDVDRTDRSVSNTPPPLQFTVPGDYIVEPVEGTIVVDFSDDERVQFITYTSRASAESLIAHIRSLEGVTVTVNEEGAVTSVSVRSPNQAQPTVISIVAEGITSSVSITHPYDA